MSLNAATQHRHNCSIAMRGEGNWNYLLLSLVLLWSACGRSKKDPQVEFTDANGRKTSSIRQVADGEAKYEIVGSGTVPSRAQELHQAARAKGEAGQYAAARTLLREAIKVAPDWAYPYYDLAFTHLLAGDMTNAMLNYREVDRLEPKGFFTTKTALWTLAREENNTFPKGTYLAFVSLEWVDPAKRRELVEMMTTNLVQFAPAWKERALLTTNAAEAISYYDKALSLDPDPETYGISMINKAVLLYNEGKKAEARHHLVELLRTNTTTTMTRTLASEVMKGW